MEKKRGKNGRFVGFNLPDTPCLQCGVIKTWKRKYCSYRCYYLSKVGKKHSWGWKIAKALKGQKYPTERVEKSRLGRIGQKRPAITGDKHPGWRGKNIKYEGLHDWVYRVLGRPQKCEMCGTTKKRMYHWANKGHTYKRAIKDWIRVCVPCHRKMDYK